ncbi:ubiquinol-cytochrome c reductase, iron-sulfur subunit [Brucella intermedia M86]|uniref:Ubiquinol-cytochrome c reductase iron-sulfur subunit n=1 Tax=Brucella intermedia M86 TaxID=1234597 RepID=M5JUR4_9HYPH|nr:ubiquinol-cytochrome c reductase, iron-sulfur subunit [Brucella intermedia M86]
MSAHDTAEPTRRDFLYIATGMAGVVGVAGLAWPFIDQMRPDASTLAAASIEVDVSSLTEGASLTVKWRGKPVFIRNRSAKEVEDAKTTALGDLKDPIARNANLASDAQATDLARSAGEGKENWLVMIGVCTHLGCVPLGESGSFGGWFCPCHGSTYDDGRSYPQRSGAGKHAHPAICVHFRYGHQDRLTGLGERRHEWWTLHIHAEDRHRKMGGRTASLAASRL